MKAHPKRISIQIPPNLYKKLRIWIDTTAKDNDTNLSIEIRKFLKTLVKQDHNEK